MGESMNISRSFVLAGTVFLIVGIGFGIHMGASGKHDFAPLHAHLNLLGFVLPMVFALTYRSFPEMGESRLAGFHFWLHMVPAAVLLVMLFLLLSGAITEAGMFPVAPIAELLIFVGALMFLANAAKNAF
jgi:hypothetical protein